MEFSNPAIDAYCVAHSSALPSFMEELERETHLRVILSNMISSPLQGAMLQFLAASHQPQNVLEIGTFTGYSTLAIASGLSSNANFHTLEKNPELEYFHQKYFTHFPCIKVHYGMALDWLQNDTTSWDFVFLDADKKVYETYYDLLIPKMSKNGLLIADNVLWKGKVLNESPDSDTKALDAFNKKVNQDDRVDNVLLPIRDGLMLIRKK